MSRAEVSTGSCQHVAEEDRVLQLTELMCFCWQCPVFTGGKMETPRHSTQSVAIVAMKSTASRQQ